MPMSNYLRNALLDHAMGTRALAMPGQLYLAVFTVAPTAAGGGTEVPTSGTGYVRQPVDFAAADTGLAMPTATVRFPEALANWGTLVAGALFDAASAGNMYLFNNLSASKAINTGDTLLFNTTDLRALFT